MNLDVFNTNRLEVKLLSLNDISDFHDLQSNAEVMQYVGTAPMNLEECRADLQKVISHYDNSESGFHVWGVYFKDELIGTCAIIQNEEGNEIGYRFRHKYWGKGFGKEITEGLLEHGFKTLKLASIWAEVDVDNLASVSILDRYLKRSGKHWNKDDNCWDYHYIITKEEYDEK